MTLSARTTAATLTGVLVAALAVVFLPAPHPAHAEANGAATSPQSGWSSWSFIRRNPTEANIEAQAQAMHDSGLVNHGFQYLNIDDFYYLNPSTTVDGYGRWVTDSARFPHGMKAVGDYVHNLGEKFGMYLTPGIPVAAYNQNTPIEGTSFHARDIVSNTSSYETNYNFGNGSMYYIDFAKNPTAAQAFLNSWANLLASWGVDYIKLDGVGDWDIPDVQHWSQALNQTGRTIHFELSNSLALKDAATWRQYANGWRVEGDIECYCSSTSYPLTSWSHVADRFTDLPAWTAYAGSGGWNDPDSVEVGNGANDGLTPDERRTQLTLWSIAAAPLVLGVDLTNLDSGDLGLLTNDEVLAVDRQGHPGHPVDRTTQQQVWVTPNGDGSYTVALFNLGSSTATVTAKFNELGFTGTATVRDLWSHTDLGTATDSYGTSLAAHASRLLRVTPQANTHTGLYYNLVDSGTGGYLAASGSTDGSPVAVSTSDGAADQQWQLVPTGDGYYEIWNRATGELVNIPGSSSTPGTALIQYHRDGNANSRWQFTPGSGNYTVTAKSDGLALDVSGGSAVQNTANGAASQHWQLVPVIDTTTAYQLVNGNSGGRVDVNNDSTADSATIVQWSDNGQDDQLWTFGDGGGGNRTVVNKHSGKLVNIPGPTTAQGTQLVQYHDDGNSNSRWRVTDAGPNLVHLVSAYDGQYVDDYNNSLSTGAAIIQYAGNGGANQSWLLVPAA
jgi:hypothetical protein